MENASKAIIMAGSVLLSLLVISSLVWMFQSIRGWKMEEASAEEATKLTEYNRKIETFNSEGLYGSEIMSLANLIDDYNTRQADLKGYQPISLTVTINPIKDSDYFGQATYNDIKTLIQNYEALEKKVNQTKAEIIYAGRTSQKIASMRDTELTVLIKETEKKELNDDEIQNKIDVIRAKADIYTNLKSELTQFKNKYFKNAPIVEYDKYNGRIKSMTFKEQGI